MGSTPTIPADRAHRAAQALARDVAFERAKRLVVGGLVATIFIGGFLLVAWRASRLTPTECVVRAVAGTDYCTVAHVSADGEEHSLPWERCVAPSRFPPVAVGTTMPCWFYPSFPSDIVFERRTVHWLTPARGAALALALALLSAGLWIGVRARRPSGSPDAGKEPRSPYREADRPPPSARPDVPPLAIAIRGPGGFLGLVFSLPFAILGLVLLALTLHLSWQTTGDVSVAGLFLIVVAAIITLTGFVGLGYRSGIVADQREDRLTIWWGLWGRWFFDHRALSSLGHVGVHVVRTQRTVVRQLELRFTTSKPRLLHCDGDVDAIADRLKAYRASA